MTRDGEWSAENPQAGFRQTVADDTGNWRSGQPGDAPTLPETQPAPRLETLLHSLVTRLEEND
ncbi:MAG: hypothetical protein D6773_08225, partial [Alphaproteobacteria bacterium]